VISIYGYTYGSVLGVFLAGMLTKSRRKQFRQYHRNDYRLHRRRDLSGLPNNIAEIFAGKLYSQPTWLPVMKFPWWICFGTIVTFTVAVLFKTSPGIGLSTSEIAASTT